MYYNKNDGNRKKYDSNYSFPAFVKFLIHIAITYVYAVFKYAPAAINISIVNRLHILRSDLHFILRDISGFIFKNVSLNIAPEESEKNWTGRIFRV